MNLEDTAPSIRSAETIAATTPPVIVMRRNGGQTDSAATVNIIEVPDELTLQVMADTDAGRNIVRCKDSEDLFRRLGI